MAHTTKRKTKKIVIVTNEIGQYVYAEIDSRAFMFNEKCDFRWEDKNGDMLADLWEDELSDIRKN